MQPVCRQARFVLISGLKAIKIKDGQLGNLNNILNGKKPKGKQSNAFL